MSAETLEQKLDRFECVIRLQMTEIDKLRTENKQLLDWIMGDTIGSKPRPQRSHSNGPSSHSRFRSAVQAY
jgi:hypothetical protein